MLHKEITAASMWCELFQNGIYTSEKNYHLLDIKYSLMILLLKFPWQFALISWLDYFLVNLVHKIIDRDSLLWNKKYIYKISWFNSKVCLINHSYSIYLLMSNAKAICFLVKKVRFYKEVAWLRYQTTSVSE